MTSYKSTNLEIKFTPPDWVWINLHGGECINLTTEEYEELRDLIYLITEEQNSHLK